MDVLSRSLAVLALVCGAGRGTVGSTASSAGLPPPVIALPARTGERSRADFAAQTVDLVNAHRATLGLRALVVGSALQASAVWKARHMAYYGYMAHDDPAPPVSRSTADRMAACGVTGSWGENIAAGYPTPSSVVNGWLGSPGHHANIENPSYVLHGRRRCVERLRPGLLGPHVLVERERVAAAASASASASATSATASSADDANRAGASGSLAATAEPEASSRTACATTRSAATGAPAGCQGHRGCCRPAHLPAPDTDAQAARGRARARKPGDRPEAGSSAEEGARLLQRTASRSPAARREADSPRRVGGVRLAAAAQRSRVDRERSRDRAAGPPPGTGAVPRQHFLSAGAAGNGAKG